MSGLKFPESQRITQSRVWLSVCTDPPNDMPSSGQCCTEVPSARSQRTTEGRMPKLGSATGSSFTVQRQSRSGSATGCAEESRKGSTPPIGRELPPQESTWPTSATNSIVVGSSSTGRPASQVANSRSPQGSGAVLAEFAGPKGDV